MINPMAQINTIGVTANPKFDNHLGDLWTTVIEEFKKQPVESTDGGNDRHFFTLVFQGVKLFVAENEVNGLTVMLPDEY